MEAGSAHGELRRDAIGLPQVLFQAITHMAPGAAIAFSILFSVQFAGPALPLSVLFALIACALVASSVGQMAKKVPSAGGLYAYVARARNRRRDRELGALRESLTVPGSGSPRGVVSFLARERTAPSSPLPRTTTLIRR